MSDPAFPPECMPPPPDPVDWDAVLARIEAGEVPAEFCSPHFSDVPDTAGVIERKAHEDAEFADKLATAKRLGAQAMLAECKEIADRPNLRADAKKVMIDTRMKLVAIWNPKQCTVPPKTDKEPQGVQAHLHVPYEQLSAEKRAEVDRFFGLD